MLGMGLHDRGCLGSPQSSSSASSASSASSSRFTESRAAAENCFLTAVNNKPKGMSTGAGRHRLVAVTLSECDAECRS